MHPPTSRYGAEKTTLAELGPGAFRALAVAGAGLVGAGIVLGWIGAGSSAYLLHSYLVSYCFWLSLSLGALFFVALQHATRAGWSVTVRRPAEVLAANTTLLTLLFLPVLVPLFLGDASLYPWNDPARVAHDHLLEHKAPYLNSAFFGIRAVGYFLVWGLLARWFLARSTEQDATGDPELTRRMERLSPVALLLFGVTITFAAFDWLMSLEPHWFSTIFGVYYFSGAAVGGVAAIILVALGLQATGRLADSVTTEHYHDLGKLLFAFVVFWGYIAFSQYMLIWYASLPEETVWYLKRQSGPWFWVILALLFGHLLVPFAGLLGRPAKRARLSLAFWAVWILAFHWLDLYWIVMPKYWGQASAAGSVSTVGVVLCVAADLCLFGGLGAVYLAGAVRVAGDRSLVPLKDPRLHEAVAFENV